MKPHALPGVVSFVTLRQAQDIFLAFILGLPPEVFGDGK